MYKRIREYIILRYQWIDDKDLIGDEIFEVAFDAFELKHTHNDEDEAYLNQFN